DAGQSLPMTLPLMVTGLVLELVDADLRTLGLLDDLPGYRDLRQRIGARSDIVAIDYESCGKGVLGARLAVELLDLNDVADGHLVLLAAGLHDGVRRHGSLLLTRQCLRGSRDQHPPDPDRATTARPSGGPIHRILGHHCRDRTGGPDTPDRLTPGGPPDATPHVDHGAPHSVPYRSDPTRSPT